MISGFAIVFVFILSAVPAPDSVAAPMLCDTLREVEILIFPPAGARLPLWYEVDWGDGEMSGWSGPLRTPVDVSRFHRYRQEGSFDIRVRARDSLGGTSPWSRPVTVRVGPGVLKWSFATLDPVVGSPSLDRDGNVYFGDEGGRVYCLSPTGSLLWDFEAKDAVYGSVVVDGEKVYAASVDSFLYCLNRQGQLVWRLFLGDEFYCPPALLADGGLVLTSDAGKVFCVDPAGRLRWSFRAGDEISSPATVSGDGRVFFAADSVYCLDQRGRRVWAFGTGEGDYFFAAPVPDSVGNLICGCTDGFLYCLGPDGRQRWRVSAPDGDEIRSEAVFGPDGSIYFGTDGYYLCRLVPGRTPEILYEAGDIVVAPPALSDSGTAYFLPDDGVVYAQSRSGRLVWTYEVAEGSKDLFYTSAPAIGPDGTVYVGSWDGGLFAFRGDAPPARSHWPQYRRDSAHTGRVSLPGRRRGRR